jgi:midasin (ATPase involved in ribosome maturation)
MVFRAICDKTRKSEKTITDRAIRYRIKAFKRAQNIASRKLAENAYANEMGINIDNFITPKELKELQDWLSNKPPKQTQETVSKSKRTVLAKVRKKTIDGFGLPANLVEEANRMADIYPDLYELENLVRYVIMSVLERAYTTNWWDNRRVISQKHCGPS